MKTNETDRIPLEFPSDVSEFRVKVEAGLIYVEVFQRGEDEPLITAQLTPGDAHRFRSALDYCIGRASQEHRILS